MHQYATGRPDEKDKKVLKDFSKKIASEAASGCKRYAFEQLNRDKVYSIIKSDNHSSMKVAESIGMKKEDEFITQYYNGDMLHFLYSVHR